MLVHDDCPRINWKMAIVESLVKGNDGLVRSATIRTRNGVTNRPVAKLYPLELSSEVSVEIADNKENSVANTEENSDFPATDSRPRCDAAQRARQKLAEWIGTIRGAPEDVEDSI